MCIKVKKHTEFTYAFQVTVTELISLHTKKDMWVSANNEESTENGRQYRKCAYLNKCVWKKDCSLFLHIQSKHNVHK